jgi:hypothetical protein
MKPHLAAAICHGDHNKNSWNVDGDACDLTKILIDPKSIRTGFAKIEKGVAPDYVWAEIAGERRSRNHRQITSQRFR